MKNKFNTLGWIVIFFECLSLGLQFTLHNIFFIFVILFMIIAIICFGKTLLQEVQEI